MNIQKQPILTGRDKVRLFLWLWLWLWLLLLLWLWLWLLSTILMNDICGNTLLNIMRCIRIDTLCCTGIEAKQYILSCHITPHHFTTYFTTPHHTTSHDTTLHHTTPHYITPHHTTPHYTLSQTSFSIHSMQQAVVWMRETDLYLSRCPWWRVEASLTVKAFLPSTTYPIHPVKIDVCFSVMTKSSTTSFFDFDFKSFYNRCIFYCSVFNLKDWIHFQCFTFLFFFSFLDFDALPLCSCLFWFVQYFVTLYFVLFLAFLFLFFITKSS